MKTLFLLILSIIEIPFIQPDGTGLIYTFDEKEQVHIEAYVEGEQITPKTTPKDPLSSWIAPLDFLSYLWKKEEEAYALFLRSCKEFFLQIAGQEKLFLWGVTPGREETGTLGQGEFFPNVRITAINGILNDRSICLETVQALSLLHGGNSIHYVFWPSKGWTKDLCHAAYARLGNFSLSAKQLACTWRKLIEEMGGVEGEGEIYHYAHSIGSVETWSAGFLMTKEEKQKIRIKTFGSPFLFDQGDFLELTHYVAKRDGISMLDVFTYAEHIFSTLPNIVFVGDLLGPPFVDHLYLAGPYIRVAEHLAKDFLQKHLDPENPPPLLLQE